MCGNHLKEIQNNGLKVISSKNEFFSKPKIASDNPKFKMKLTLTIILAILSVAAKASDLEISRPILYMESGTAYTVFNLSWDNAWSNEKNNDGIWLFFKSLLQDGGYQHIQVLSEGHSVVSVFSDDDYPLDFEIPQDGIGLFLFPKNSFRGKIEAAIKVMLNPKSFENVNTRNSSFTAYGIEMVKIPKGSFELGDPDAKALEYGSFYQPNAEGNFAGLVSIKSEDQELEVSTTGDLYYRKSEGYEGDQKGLIPSAFPKGVSPFYIMKYEPTEGQYAVFLNSLSQSQIGSRLIFNEENYYAQGGTISQNEGQYSSSYPDKPCLFMSWDDAMAYADWAGLRPMTEFEFTKAARGTSKPKAGEFPWGSNNKEKMQRFSDSTGMLVMLNGWQESYLKESNREYFGASYYWVMDMAGSMWERLITVGHPNGRNFRGSHGDGILSSDGNATNENWPDGADESGGIGFRGGGFYGYERAYHEFNPFSPISYRPYGGWHGGMRTNSYGARFVRNSN